MSARPGSVLALVILGLVLLEAMIAGTLLIAADATASAGIDARSLLARTAAESAIRERLADWPADSLHGLSIGSVVAAPARAVPGGASEIEVLGRARFLVRGAAPGLGVPRTLAMVAVATLDADSLRSLFTGALHSAGPVAVQATATLDGAAAATDGSCPAGPAPGLIAHSGETAIDPAATIAGTPALADASAAPAVPVIAGIPAPSLAPLADAHATGSVTPQPGPCNGSDPIDWGDPSATGPPCADRLPFIVATGDLEITGGTGQGTLLVLGRLRIGGDARFHGAIIARSIDLGAATLVGAVRTFGPDTSRIAGTILFDPCTLERALGAPTLRRPFRRGPRLWLPVR